jgi:transcriptional regulator
MSSSLVQNHAADKICKLPEKLLKVSEGKPFKVPYISSTVTVCLTEGFAVSKQLWEIYLALCCEVKYKWREGH